MASTWSRFRRRRPSAGKTEIRQLPSGVLVRLSGVIDESFRKDDLAIEQPIVVLDLGGVTAMTSYGIREWTRGLALLRADYYCFVRCPALVMAQFNMVARFGGQGEVVSLLAPYLCTACSKEFEHLVDLRREHDPLDTHGEPPPLECPACGADAEFDDLPELFFQYVNAVPRPQPPAAASAIIDSPAPGTARRFHIKKEIHDTVTALWLSGHCDEPRSLRRLSHGLQGHVVCVAADLESATAKSLSELIARLTIQGIEPCLARVRPAIGAALLGFTDALRAARIGIVSLRLPFRCGSCDDERHLDLGRSDLLALGTEPGAAGYPCPRCGTALVAMVPARDLERLGALPMVPSPKPVASYLAARPEITAQQSEVVGFPRRAGGAPPVIGRYEILRQLGRGGMGEVFLARRAGPGDFEKLVVLKMVRRDRLGGETVLDEILREAKIAARLSHRNIVQIFDCSRAGDEYFIVMEYVRGIDARSAIALSSRGQLRWPTAVCCRIATDLCDALEAAHGYHDDNGVALPIVHRDVSPENVLLGEDGTVKLTDFGVARAADLEGHTEPGVFKGKQRYAPPERLSGHAGALDPSADVYGTGVLLFELLSGRRHEPAARAAARTGGGPASRAGGILRDDVSPELEAVVARAMAANPAERFATAAAFRDALAAAAGELAATGDVAAWVAELGALRSGDDVDDAVVLATASETSPSKRPPNARPRGSAPTSE